MKINYHRVLEIGRIHIHFGPIGKWYKFGYRFRRLDFAWRLSFFFGFCEWWIVRYLKTGKP